MGLIIMSGITAEIAIDEAGVDEILDGLGIAREDLDGDLLGCFALVFILAERMGLDGYEVEVMEALASIKSHVDSLRSDEIH